MPPSTRAAACVSVAAVAAVAVAASISTATATATPWQWQTTGAAPQSLVAPSGACADVLCYLTGGSVVPPGQPGSPPTPVATDAVWVYNVSSGDWAENPAPLILPRSGHASVVVWDSPSHYTLWVLGGQQKWDDQISDFTPFVDVEFYDPLVGEWKVSTSLPNATSRLGCAAVNTTIYCVGGVIVYTDPTGNTMATVTHTVRSLDTANAAAGWKENYAFPIPVSQAGVAAVGNTIYVTGGTCFWAQCICEAGVPPAAMAALMMSTTSFALPAGAAKPIPCPSPALTATVYAWDTTTVTGWVGAAPLNVPRCGGGAFFDPVTSSLFYAGGASGSDNVAATVEVFDTQNLTAGWRLAPIQPIADVAAAWGGFTRYTGDGAEVGMMIRGPAGGRPVGWLAAGVVDIINIVPTNITAVLYDDTAA